MHRRAATAEIVIVNHHLFFADLAVRRDDFASILPEYSAVIFDEAHELEDVASQYFGTQVSNYRLEELVRDTENALAAKGLAERRLSRLLRQLRKQTREFFALFPEDEGRFAFDNREEFLLSHGDHACEKSRRSFSTSSGGPVSCAGSWSSCWRAASMPTSSGMSAEPGGYFSRPPRLMSRRSCRSSSSTITTPSC
jgi:hypothetical protein